ncbi:MAG: cobyrinic acid a,c-diamide synthase [Peptococcaceae bacterium BRH_c4b]|nr:MAG: cobyrinic acid a,c-diamide synthase [Peptococcaceae bacterium BRH_c4b]
MTNYPRLVIAGVHSGVGKTTVSTALMAALARSGIKVQPFKVGPDYIDPGYHTAATGKCSRNLDAWFVGEDGIREIFMRAARDADISIIEGVMGLYDGRGSGAEGSTAHVAKTLKAPVLLVLDARSMARSAAALVLGYKNFDPEVNLAGVFLNRVGSERHYNLLRQAIEECCGVPVIGYANRWDGLDLPERHLGLLPTAEKDNLDELLLTMADSVKQGVDPDRLVELSRIAPPIAPPEKKIFPITPLPAVIRLGVVMDSAFNFYYQDGLELLSARGAELVYCSALSGSFPGDIDGLYIGGGFPEMFARELSANHKFIDGLRAACAAGMPVYAECGGFMYMTRAVTDFEGNRHELAGVVPGECRMQKKRAALGYVTATALDDNILVDRGEVLRGHEFHYSVLELDQGIPGAYRLAKEGTDGHRTDGYASGNILASYLHINFAGHPEAAGRFIGKCIEYKEMAYTFSGSTD